MSVIFGTVPFTDVIMLDFLCALTRLFPLDYSWQILLVSFCRIMSAGRQSTAHGPPEDRGDRAALKAKIMDRPVIAERNVVCSDIMVVPLDSIHDIIQTYHWGYLHPCACVV